ncbi:hypothetical protein PF005_g15211 [Phytophthora fragariae]|uniref:Uncharacterized protein n=2 Tax=Phytophthora fragariae TaxID=53985 RepID=A0A6A3EI62_9STRA|nr:hypothetical protein PF003_g19420 [Phytophthora fragariae]KAE8933282.1 hypothetical protein PF009_g16714 [Phytophthora fragariae]KAE9000170.1 hypothetical protein PF011_g14308 [Phytophthora fragariae]KAE9136639.1 hypothetical protein PF006_g14341 [Phytophthora fragariae]KAE9200795.1 hypothetical protein PF005_g15211 [Phytophthora fragariae]
MASPFASVVMPVWQDPFVQVIKFGMTHRNVGWHAQGDVEQTQDQHIHKNVFRIRGAIAATNYLRVPRDAAKGMHGLGLTGRYAYMQIRRIGDLPMTIHLDFVTNKKTALRFTLSSIYQLLRSTGTALRVPLSLDARWTVVVIDMVALLELHSFNQYARETYRHLKTITLCASMNVRNFFVSPTLYTPSTLPSTLRFPENFGDQYRWLMLPSETNSSLDDGSYRQLDPVKQEDLRIAATPKSAARVRRSSVESTRTIQNEVVFDEQSPTHESAAETITKVSPRTRDTNLRRDRNDILSKADQILRDAGIFDVNTDTTNNQQPMDAAYQSPLDSPAMRYASLTKRGLRAKIVSSSTKAEWPDPILELDRVIGFSNDFPRMLLWLPDNSACVYTSSSTIIIREFRDENTDPTRSQRVSTEAVKGSVETTRSATATREHFLYGHSVSICALAVSSDGGLLASAEVPTQTKKQGGVRLWGLASRECVTVVKAQPKGVHTLCFSTPSKRRLLLCVVGRDECFRTQIFIWDCSCLRHGKEEALSGAAVSLMARQTSDFPIDRIAFSPYEQQDHYHLVSCGRENIRYWRVNPNTGHLTGCPVILNEYSRGTVFTDIGFDTIVETHPSDIRRVRPLYVASSLGTLLVIDYDSKQVMCVYQLHDASINCLSINEGFCVTGSDDCFLRVWPLDFTDFFLEAHHEAGVSCLDVSPDGMKVLVGSRNNAIGLLDIADQQYATLLRSHTKDITAMAPAPWGSPLASLLLEDARSGGIGTAESELVTASSDGTLRVWDALSGYQLYEFDMQQERVTSLAASPVSSAIVAVGFASGCTRIFDVHRTPASGEINTIEAPSSMLREFRQHQSSILHVEFDIDAEHLFTSGAGKQLCLYDARQQDYLPLKMLLADFDPEDGHFVLSHDKKWLAVVSGDRKNIVMVDPCSLRVVATVQPPKLPGISSQEESLKLVRFSNRSTELLVLSASDRLHVFSLPGRGFVQSMPLLGQDGISALVTSANAKYMATGGVDGSLRVWNWDDRGRIGRMHQSFIGHAGKVKDLAFTKDDKRVVATGESTAICIWQFHGDSSPMSPRAKSGSMDIANIFPFEEHDSNQEMNGEQSTNNDASALPSSKSNFKLTLEADALKLESVSGVTQHEKIDSVLSNKTDLVDTDVPTTVVEMSKQNSGDLVLSSALGGFNSSNFAWSYSTGKMVYTRKTILVVEDVASGRQVFYDDHSINDSSMLDPSDEIILMQLSPSGEYVATITSRFDVVAVRPLASRDEFANKINTASSHEDNQILITLPLGTCSVSALAFGERSHQRQVEELLCMACEVKKPDLSQEHVIVVASTLKKCIVWTSTTSKELQPTRTRQIVATSDTEFLLLSGERSGISTLTVYPDAMTTCFDTTSDAELEPLIGVFPTQVELISLYNRDGTRDRLCYLVGIDNDRYCYFYDLHRNTFIATTQLLLLSSKTRNGSSQPDNKPKTAASTRKVVEFMEWVTTAGKSLLITGSRSENALYVHGLPMVSTKHSARVQVDWQRVARAGVSLLCKVVLNGSGMLRSLSVDPARDAGIATTEDGTIVLVHFSTPPTTKVLRETATVGADCNIPFAVSNASWALDGAVLLSMAQNDNSIRVWLPELSREIASFQVESAICTCFAVKPFSTTPDSVPQSMVMAGYSDGSLRVFDLCEMRLLSRFELAPSFAKSARYDGGAFDRIIFVGALTALIVTKDNCVLLVDVSNALEQTEEAQSARGANIRPKRVNARVSKKSIQENSRLSRARTTGGCREGREVVYRELTLLPSSYRRRKRLPGLAKSEEVHVEVGAIDVMTSGDTNIHPFLIVVKYTGPIRYGEGRCVIKVFAEPTMSVLAEDDVAATDEWRLHSRPDLEHSVAVFMADSTSKSVRVLHSSSQRRPDSTPTETCAWGLELRDCVQRRLIHRFVFSIHLEHPVLLRCIHAALSPDAPEAAEMLLLSDANGRMAVLHLSTHQLIPINSRTTQALQLTSILNTSSNSLLLSSPSQLAVASLTFH